MSLTNKSHNYSETKVSEHYCNVQLRVTEVTYKWTIDKFSKNIDFQSEMRSEIFPKNHTQIKWNIKLNKYQLCHYTYQMPSYISLYLELDSSNDYDVNAEITFAIINSKGESTYVQTFQKYYKSGESYGI